MSASLAIAASGNARASCNIIPGSNVVFMTQRQCQTLVPILESPTGFRGALGWSDHRFAGPRESLDEIEKDLVHLQIGKECTNGQCIDCVAPKLKDVDGARGVDPNDYLVALVFGAASGDTRESAVLIGSTRNCRAVNENSDTLSCPNLRLRRCLSVATYEVNAESVAFSFPEDRDLEVPGGSHRFAGPTAIVVVEKPSDLTKPLLPCDLETKRCADVLAGEGAANVGLCIDEFYRDAGSTCDTHPKYIDPMVSHFITLPADNEFDRVCTDSKDPDLGDCATGTAQASTLEMALDVDGDILIPMYWYEAIKRKTEGKAANRRVEGSSTYPGRLQDTLPVRVPGEEFLEAQPRLLQSLKGSKRPLFQVDGQNTNELGLWGHADKPDSVLYIARRKPVRRVCKDVGNDHDHQGEACEGVQLRCATDCGEDGKSACTCDCLAVPEYFACNGGNRNGAPCSRPSHCSGGTCEKEPTCAPANCPSLFELRGREEAGGKVVITREVAQGDSIPGVCEAGAKKGDKCAGPSDCDGGARCARFRAVADLEVTTTLPPTTTTTVP